MLEPTVILPPSQSVTDWEEVMGASTIKFVVTVLSHKLKAVKISVYVPETVYVFVPTVVEPPSHTVISCVVEFSGRIVKSVVTVLSHKFAAIKTSE